MSLHAPGRSTMVTVLPNKGGYTAVGCGPPRYLSPSPSPPRLSPRSLPPSSLLITSLRHTLSLAVSVVEKMRYRAFEKKGLRMDQRTDLRTDRPSYRDAWTHLKTVCFRVLFDKECCSFQSTVRSRVRCRQPGKKRLTVSDRKMALPEPTGPVNEISKKNFFFAV